MTFRTFSTFALVTSILLLLSFFPWSEKGTQTPFAHAQKPNENVQAAPSVFLPEHSFEFAPVVAGTAVTHDFIIQNKGTAPLTIDKVRTG